MSNKQDLLKKLKGNLSITWDDIELEDKLMDKIIAAEQVLNFKLGAEIDYSVPGMEQTLLLIYCMYDYNNCLNEFNKNYINDIYQLRAKYAVKRRKNEKNRYL